MTICGREVKKHGWCIFRQLKMNKKLGWLCLANISCRSPLFRSCTLNSATRCPSMGLHTAPLAAVEQNDQQVAALSRVQTSQRRFQEGPERGKKRAKHCFYSLT